MFDHPVFLAVLVALAVLLAACLWSAWRGRRIDFIHQVALDAQAAAAGEQVFDLLIPVLVDHGYRTAAQGGNTTVFEHRFWPAWTILVAIFFFPFGLPALLARARETVVIVSRDEVIELHGSCSKTLADFVIAVADDVAARSVYVR